MANRHKAHRKAGGKVFYAGGESNVAKEAEEKKHGGKVAEMHGKKGHHRLEKRARGGKVGADHHPFSSASIGEPAGYHSKGGR
jgi:hypothetical protein